jgi:hypothetical protein
MIGEASAPASRLSRLLSMAHADVWIVFLCVSCLVMFLDRCITDADYRGDATTAGRLRQLDGTAEARGSSSAFLPPSPPAEEATASQDP